METLEDMMSTISGELLLKEHIDEEKFNLLEEMGVIPSLYDEHIDDSMSVLEKNYSKMLRAASDIDEQIEEFKKANSVIFQTLQDLEKQKEEILAPTDEWKKLILRRLELSGEKKYKGMEVDFSYVAATTKKNFNKGRLEKELPAIYEKYVDKIPQKAYIKTSVHLLPKELRDAADKIGE